MNPLLDSRGLPRFDAIRVEHVAPAIEALIAANREVAARLGASVEPPSWSNLVEPLYDAGERLDRAWSQVAHLNAVVNTAELREAYNAALPKVTALHAELAQDPALYARFRRLRESAAFVALDAAQRKLVEDELRDFRLGGAELAPERRDRLKAVQEELASLGARFEDNVLDATNEFSLLIEDESRLAGLPEEEKLAAREAAREDGEDGFKLTLHAPCYWPVMSHCTDRALRHAMYRAYVTRASEHGPAQWDNGPLIQRILALRAEEARLLGYSSFAEVSLATKMARSAEEVLRFLRDLAARSKPFAERDYRELEAFAASDLGIERMEAWDLAFASERLRERLFSFSDTEVKQYFTEPRVLDGLFRLVETLYDVRIVPGRASVWHPDARFFDILGPGGERVGQFYLDLYARAHKRGGAWMDDAIQRRRTASGVQTPVAYLTCNFSRPVGGRPALFTHDEVTTLFHEFGHGLHLLLTEVDHLGVSGLSRVEWDAIELPSQIMENFCWEWEVVRAMSAHVETGEPMPHELFERMLAAKNFQAGMQFVRQVELSLFDMLLHSGFDTAGGLGVRGLLQRVREEVAVVPRPEFERFENSFTHVFGGSYAAGYYSYKWAEVLSADAFSLFEENGVLAPAVGARFRREILGVGGSRPAIDSFIAFRGRPPSLEALLRHNGLAAPPQGRAAPA